MKLRSTLLLRAVLAFVVLLAASGCRDELPTAVGPETFPGGAILTSILVDLPAAEFLHLVGHFDGYTGVADAPYGLVANRFEGLLVARTLFRLVGFPDTVQYAVEGAPHIDTVFTYGPGTIVTTLDTLASGYVGEISLTLRALEQAWDPASATWTHAVDTAGARVAWAEPGGALGRVLARATWITGDPEGGDSLVWELDSLAVAEIASPGFPGVAIVAEDIPVRAQVGAFTLRTSVRPATHPEVTIPQTITTGFRTFIFDPPFPQPTGEWQVGGLTAARTLFTVRLPETVPGCPPDFPGGASCPARQLRDVNLNQVALLLDPLPVVGGFRPLVPMLLRLRLVGDPELGRRAPLGRPITEVAVEPRLFLAGADTVVTLSLTEHVQRLLTAEATAAPTLALALLAEPEGGTFGYARFSGAVRLRIVYTIQNAAP